MSKKRLFETPWSQKKWSLWSNQSGSGPNSSVQSGIFDCPSRSLTVNWIRTKPNQCETFPCLAMSDYYKGIPPLVLPSFNLNAHSLMKFAIITQNYVQPTLVCSFRRSFVKPFCESSVLRFLRSLRAAIRPAEESTHLWIIFSLLWWALRNYNKTPSDLSKSSLKVTHKLSRASSLKNIPLKTSADDTSFSDTQCYRDPIGLLYWDVYQFFEKAQPTSVHHSVR